MGTTHADDTTIGGLAVPVDRMPGHWVLARLGKRVLRPGGRELTDRLLAGLAIGPGDDVVELAPGLGSTTKLVLAADPRSYTGVDRDPAAARRVADAIAGPGRRVVEASATDTGLDDDSADVAFGEAYLTMQPDRQKREVAAELARIVRPGGRIALHEVAFAGALDPEAVEAIRRRDVTMIACVNDVVAIGVLSALRDNAIAVPGEVSVFGFDDMVWSHWPLIDLTTIRQPLAELGRDAVELLVERLTDPERPQRDIVLPVSLVERGSTRQL